MPRHEYWVGFTILGTVAAAGEAREFKVPQAMNGWRVDRALAALCGDLARSVARKAVEGGFVRVGAMVCRKPRERVEKGGHLVMLGGFHTDREKTGLAPKPLRIIAEDEHLLVVNKPAGMVSHPAAGNRSGTLVDSITAGRPEMADLPRCGLVHRLDKDTSGLLAVAKNLSAAQNLRGQFKQKSARRIYMAIVHGLPSATGELSLPIARDPANRLKMRVHLDGRVAKTRFTMVRKGNKFSLLRLALATGRTHQIRAHLEHAGYPVVGDRVYRRYAGMCNIDFPRQMLHAAELELLHPCSGEKVAWRAELPEDFRAALADAGLA